MFMGAIALGVLCIVLAAMSILFSVYSSYSVRDGVRRVAFILSMEPQDTKTSLKVLRSHSYIDSVAIVSSSESRLFIEDIVGTSLDSIELNSTLPTVLAVFPHSRCSTASDFASITELCERLPLTDNIIRDFSAESAYISQRRTHFQMSFLLSAVLGMMMVLVCGMYAQRVGTKAALDASLLYHSGASPLFASLPWIIMVVTGTAIGAVTAASILGIALWTTHALSGLFITDIVEVAVILSAIFFTITFLLVPCRVYFSAFFASGNDEDKD